MAANSNFRPICVNHGCDKPVIVTSGTISDPGGWRVHCGHCQAASYGKWPHASGVTPFKIGRCSNIKGKLGFSCVINWTSVKAQGLKVSTEIDHINGDPNDNLLTNLQELCPICHREKGRREGNFDGWRNYRAG